MAGFAVTTEGLFGSFEDDLHLGLGHRYAQLPVDNGGAEGRTADQIPIQDHPASDNGCAT
jgi:hypothetical protein